MQVKKNNIASWGFMCLLLLCLSSCDKVPVQFGNDGTAGDPNITLIDTFTLPVSTLQVDSFSTYNTGFLIAGSHHDPALGYIESKAFFEIAPPALDLRNTSNCVYDSLVMYIKSSSGYMGDTSVPFTLNVHEVTQAMDVSEIPLGYNVNTVAFNPVPMAFATVRIRPSNKDSFQIKLPDDFGRTLFRMFKTNSDTVTNIDAFKRFFKGICLAGGAANNALYYFDKTAAANFVIRLHYTIADALPKSMTADFAINTSSYNFNSFTYNKTGTPLSVFVPGKKQLINSTATNNTAYLNYNSGLFPKISLGNLFSIKELHPYVQVLKATLEIKPIKQSFGTGTDYSLPSLVELRLIDDNNYTAGTPLIYPGTTQSQVQYGSLFIDNLYGQNTSYTYDVTSFVNAVLAEGAFSQKALLMYPYQSTAIATDQRLLITNSINKTDNNQIKLTLSVLGL